MKQYDDVRSIINRAAENKMIEQTSCKIRELSMRAPMPKSEKNYSLFYKANKILTAAGLEELEVINSIVACHPHLHFYIWVFPRFCVNSKMVI